MNGKQLGAADKKSQLDKFREAARELECDDDEDRFKKRLGQPVQNPKKHSENEGD